MLGEIGIMTICAYGLYGGAKYIVSPKFKVERLWNKALKYYPHQTSIRNINGNTFRLMDIKVKGDQITGRLHIPPGLSTQEFDKIIPALERMFYGTIERTSDYHVNIVSGRKELKKNVS